jgi:cellulose synthase/poly-beta-1,6-N-acetylglucosamine synthase-like glycosyltransferase
LKSVVAVLHWRTREFCLSEASACICPQIKIGEPFVSIIIPARNEAGNIDELFERVPQMGSETELVFVEGHSTDKTYEVIGEPIDKHPQWRAKLFRQMGIGKGDSE